MALNLQQEVTLRCRETSRILMWKHPSLLLDQCNALIMVFSTPTPCCFKSIVHSVDRDTSRQGESGYICSWLKPSGALVGCRMASASSCRYLCWVTVSLPGSQENTHHSLSSRQPTPFFAHNYSVISYSGFSAGALPPAWSNGPYLLHSQFLDTIFYIEILIVI